MITVSKSVQCEPGWKFGQFTESEEECWKVMPVGKPWGFAAYECKKLNAHLPVPKDEEDNQLLLTHLKSQLELPRNLRVTWLGYKLSGWPIKWMEVHTGVNLEDYQNYTNWKEGHPANNYFAAIRQV